MRCWRRSTTWHGSLAAVLVAAAASSAAAGTPAAHDQRVADAVVRAVRARLGDGAEVALERLRLAAVRELPDAIEAVPEVGSRFGRTIRFALVEAAGGGRRGRPVGTASAGLRIAMEGCRAVRDIARGESIREQDVAAGRFEVMAGRLEPLPSCAAIVNGRARRDLAAGEAVARQLVTAPQLVAAGSRVVGRVSRDGIEVEAALVSLQAGRLGDEIRLMNQESRKAVRGRVIGANQVEVLR